MNYYFIFYLEKVEDIMVYFRNTLISNMNHEIIDTFQNKFPYIQTIEVDSPDDDITIILENIVRFIDDKETTFQCKINTTDINSGKSWNCYINIAIKWLGDCWCVYFFGPVGFFQHTDVGENPKEFHEKLIQLLDGIPVYSVKFDPNNPTLPINEVYEFGHK